MIYNLDNKEDFENYILNAFESRIPCKTKYIIQYIIYKWVLIINKELVEDILNKYNIKYNFFEIDNKVIKLLYLKEFEKDDNLYESIGNQKLQNFYDEIIPFLLETDLGETSLRSVMKEDILLFNNICSISYSYFIFNSTESDLIRVILNDCFNMQIEIFNLDINNDTYNIHNLSYFEIQENLFETKGNSSLAYMVLLELIRCNISFCELCDNKGSLTISNKLKLKTDIRFFYRIDLKKPFKSSWEANVARILNYRKISWEYEKSSFERFDTNDISDGYYFPDFFLDDNIILEVKGFWNPNSRNKAWEFQKHYTEYKYYTIDSDMYFNLKEMYSKTIIGWEENCNESLRSYELQIVGLSVGIRKQTFISLKIGDKVIFKRDSKNAYDINAILALTTKNREIGFISKDWAVIYAPKIDLGMTFDLEIVSIEPKVINIKVKRNNPEKIIVYDFLII